MKSVRRPHNKSRWGCHACKQRHIKRCRPAVFIYEQCAVSAVGAVENSNSNSSLVASSVSSSAGSRVYVTTASPTAVSPPSGNDGPSIPPANMVELELMHNIYTSDLNLMPRLSSATFHRLVLNLAPKTPFLMNELLAFSSRHLAETRPAQAAYYQHQALQYQTHALRIYNEQRHAALTSPDSCLAVFFFSWLIGQHMLSDVRAAGETAGVSRGTHGTHGTGDTAHRDTLDRFIAYMHTYRGLRAVTSTTFEVIMQTDMADLIQDVIRRLAFLSDGPETAPLRDAVRAALAADGTSSTSSTSSERERRGFDAAIARLQWAIDARNDTRRPVASRKEDLVMAISMWPLVLGRRVFARIVDKMPAALAVLAHFAVLLFWCRDIWIFGDVGALLLEDIVRTMPAAWQGLLAWPLAMIQGARDGQQGRDRHGGHGGDDDGGHESVR
ncbi:hypothetical protein SPBR_00578 [Sporothrix brasiliensis 5110]|uniref:Uncharacterized protein n=1 Tax=Sporothrix brasiliensis 5110 TaxID=1398154 RepID=A0A0C2INY7_9PEZI|nr:uncharacterized protein SPBR_00578 [Sporothrix brasiliensis 5110]KIH90756.1 hypothetical protein SPBR_00578 [Sporothrix brasiliensis 5110]